MYLDLLAVLEDGEQPIEPDPPKQEPEPGPEKPEEEKPMTVAEMRQRIKEQTYLYTILTWLLNTTCECLSFAG